MVSRHGDDGEVKEKVGEQACSSDAQRCRKRGDRDEEDRGAGMDGGLY